MASSALAKRLRPAVFRTVADVARPARLARPGLAAVASPAIASASSRRFAASVQQSPGPASAATSSPPLPDGSVDATALALVRVAARWRQALREAGGFQHLDRQFPELLAGCVQELQRAAEELKAPPTFVRLLQTALDPCWDWAAGKTRLRTARAIIQALDRVERRLMQLHEAERMADTRFESMRMDLGAEGARTGGSRAVSPHAAREQRNEKTISDRQYLSHDGVGGRTQFERSRNAAKLRLQRGTVAAAEYRAAQQGQASAPADDLEDLEQRVEDQIQIAIAKGEFDNVEGKGRPLKRLQAASDNPFLDRTDRLGYDLLQKHGYLPEWIEQQKEIRKTHDDAVKICAGAWLACGEEPSSRWLAQRDSFQEAIQSLNRRVRNYNLICPVASQLPQFVFTEELRRVRRNAREILGDEAQRAAGRPAAAAAPAPRRLMAPLRQALSGGGSGLSPPPSGRSMWERIADAVAPLRR